MTSPSPDSGVMLRTDHLSKRYREITALSDLTLEIPRGKVFGYIGHNGAGKTTTIRILAGLLRASGGKAYIAGVDVTADRDGLKQRVGYLPDDFGVYDQMRVWEYLDFFGAAFKIPRRQRKRRMDEVLDITGSEYMRDRFVDTLSKGMKQRVGIARTLMHDPDVLLLDEPANGLDPRARVEMRNLIRRLADGGKTILVSSHILPELATICDLVGIIHQGVLQAAGPLEKVLLSIRRDRLMEVRMAGDPAAGRRAIEGDPRCSEVCEGEEGLSAVRFRFKEDDASLAELLEKLIAKGVKVVNFREVPLSLEDAFMALSGVAGSEELPEKTEA